ncbi:MAG: NAD(P)H-dependent oxidoreductase [Bdellovibrionales bacterium]|nr:NAD(P)H-dependent oxidoreductase [Bdellovibrionales bacterium]
MQISLVNGSLRSKSVCSIAVSVLSDLLKKTPNPCVVQEIDLNQIALPLMNPEAQRPSAFDDLKKKIDESAGIVLFSPDYHGCMSGTLKNFLDYFWTEFAGKTFGYVCSSHEKGLTAMDQMRTAVRQCYGWSLPYGVSLNEKDLNEQQTEITNQAILKRFSYLAHDMSVYSRLLNQQFESDKTSGAQSFAAHYRR